MRRWLIGITDIGDLAVLVPLAATILIWLLRCSSSAAARWILALSICVGLTALLKIIFHGCPPTDDMHSPSGHTTLSTLVYGALALTAATAWSGIRRFIAIGVGAGLVLSIAVSRLLLEAHTLAEIGLGFIIGIVCLALFGQKYLQSPHTKVWPLLIIAGVLILVLHGSELHAEELLHRIGGYVRLNCS